MSQSDPGTLILNPTQKCLLANLTEPLFDGPRKVVSSAAPAINANMEAKTEQHPSIALVTMTKNGIKKLPNLFASVVGFVSKAVILDTGSTDGAQEWVRTQKFFPATLIETPFVNFQETRNALMKCAKDSADWLLLLDDDMGLKFQEPMIDVKKKLSKAFGAYLLEHDHGTLTYWVGRIVRGDLDWKYKGVTHEYLEGSGFGNPQLEGVKVWHTYGHPPEKFIRDLHLLSADIARDPNDYRTIFYLANTLRDMGHTLAAIRFYEMRVKMGGWDQEVYSAMYEAARLARDPVAMAKAHAFRPQRAEAAAWLSGYYKFIAVDQITHAQWERIRAAIPMTNDVLFVNPMAYGPQFAAKLEEYT
jgi:glycosyltransferase involved in cell wall biosynthesis